MDERLISLYSPGQPDPLADIPESGNFAVHAGDGHSHGHATHDAPVDGKVYPTGHLYLVDIRTNFIRHLDLMKPPEGGKKEHDMATLKRCSSALRMNELTGKKVLII